MILLYVEVPNKNNIQRKDPLIINKGTFDVVMSNVESLTEEYEKEGYMCVNKVNIDPENNQTWVYEFATERMGHLFDLVVCGGVAGSISRLPVYR